jgi:hypothetical protein
MANATNPFVDPNETKKLKNPDSHQMVFLLVSHPNDNSFDARVGSTSGDKCSSGRHGVAPE